MDFLLLVLFLVVVGLAIVAAYGWTKAAGDLQQATARGERDRAHLASEEDARISEHDRADAAEATVASQVVTILQLSADKDGLIERLDQTNENLSVNVAGWASARVELARIEAEAANQVVTATEMQALRDRRCVHCGGVHDVNCPRVKRIRFRLDGQTPAEVEYWADGEWPKDRVVWLEDVRVEEPATT